MSRRHDILDGMLEHVHKDSWGSEVIEQLRDEIKTYILAGHETSASMLTWSLYELSKNPTYAARIRMEANNVFGELNSIIFLVFLS